MSIVPLVASYLIRREADDREAARKAEEERRIKALWGGNPRAAELEAESQALLAPRESDNEARLEQMRRQYRFLREKGITPSAIYDEVRGEFE